jgi:hypothetical protein
VEETQDEAENAPAAAEGLEEEEELRDELPDATKRSNNL